MRHLCLGALSAILLTGCATNLQAVRDFADETRKISVAFDPVLSGAVDQCQQQFLQRRIYTSDAPLARFDPQTAIKQSADTCQMIADKNAIAKGLSQALANYAEQLSALAADGVASQVDDNYDALAAKLAGFNDLPPEKVGATSSLLKYITRSVIAKSQREAIADALRHEEAVGALADALVVYTDRIYATYVAERLRDQPSLVEMLRGETSAPISSRLLLMGVYQQTLDLQAKQQTTASLRSAVSQMKASMHDLNQNLGKLSDKERLVEVKKLSKEVRSLYQQLAKAF